MSKLPQMDEMFWVQYLEVYYVQVHTSMHLFTFCFFLNTVFFKELKNNLKFIFVHIIQRIFAN